MIGAGKKTSSEQPLGRRTWTDLREPLQEINHMTFATICRSFQQKSWKKCFCWSSKTRRSSHISATCRCAHMPLIGWRPWSFLNRSFFWITVSLNWQTATGSHFRLMNKKPGASNFCFKRHSLRNINEYLGNRFVNHQFLYFLGWHPSS